MLINPIGSNNGLYKAIYGLWLALPLMFMIVYELKQTINSSRLKSIFAFNTTMLSLLVLASLALHFTNSYWDRANRFKLNTAFEYKYLRYVLGDKERVGDVDETLEKINQLTDPNDVVLMLRMPPQFYYLTETKPFFDFNVSQLVFHDMTIIDRLYKAATLDKKFPKLLVYSKKRSRLFSTQHDRLMEWLKTKYIDELGYQLVWENHAFAIAVPPDEV